MTAPALTLVRGSGAPAAAVSPERMLAYALAYLELGWNALPIRRDTKRPRVKWKAWQTTRVPAALVRSWFQTWPDSNVAVVTGAISGLAVLDLDGAAGWQNALALGALPPESTPRVRTRKGLHYYLAHPGHVVKPWAHPEDVARIPEHLRGIDFRGDGGYVVAPPSLHAEGHVYAWEVPPHGLTVD